MMRMNSWIGCAHVLVVLLSVGCSASSSTGGSGGSLGSGGATKSGGAPGSGGAASASGGTVGSGGAASVTGGSVGSGGNVGSGGVTSASGGNVGSGGVGSGGSAGAAGATGPCGAAGILVCDHFENGIEHWVKHSMAGTNLVVDTTKGHNSSSSIKVTSSNAPFGHISTPPGVIPANKDFYVRVWANFAKSTAMISGHVAYVVGATSEDNSGIEVRFGSSSTFSSAPMSMLDLNIIGSGAEFTQFSSGDITGGNPSTTQGVALEANKWYCLEAFFKGSTSEFRAWVDDKEITALHVTDFGGRRANWAPAYTLVKVGGQDFSGSIGTVWYDDVAMGTQQIHCGP